MIYKKVEEENDGQGGGTPSFSYLTQTCCTPQQRQKFKDQESFLFEQH